MYAAVLGQCGPRVPRLKSLFHSSKYTIDTPFIGEERQAELEAIWQDIGEEKYQKLEELRHTVSTAVDQIYERALEECEERKMVLQEMVLESEVRLKEVLGPNALQAIAPKESSLQVRLNLNLARLHEIENSRNLGGYGRVGGLVVLMELRHRVSGLREMLNLPALDSSVDLDEVLVSTTEALHKLCAGKVASVPVFIVSKSTQKPIFQRLQGFYQTLCSLESVWMDSHAAKDFEKKSYTFFHGADMSPQLHLQELKEMEDDREKTLDVLFQRNNDSPSTIASVRFGWTMKRSSSKFRKNSKCSGQVIQYSEEDFELKQLSHKILKKLADISKHVKCAASPVTDIFSPFSSHSQSPDIDYSQSTDSQGTGRYGTSTDSGMMLRSASISPSSEDNGSSTAHSDSPETIIKTFSPSCWANVGVSSSLWAAGASELDKTTPSERHPHHSQCQLVACNLCCNQQKLNGSTTNENGEDDSMASPNVSVNANGNNPSESFSIVMKSDTVINESQSVTDSSNERWPLTSITNNQASHLPLERKASLLPTPPPPPPPPPLPPPLSVSSQKTAQPSKSAKLKRSSTLGKLYMEMKRKVDGAASQAQTADLAVPRRSIFGTGTGEGMAEALAEITRRSSYFKKIEDDVKQHAIALLEMKSELESFETHDMQKLLRFHESIEAQLEILTDESQVLARFEGFPVKKLEAVRAAASLYLKLSSLAQQLQNWPVELPVSAQIDKVTSFFEKVKTDIEAIDRTKDEDLQHFINQKIHFSFGTVTHIKEAIVDLSSRCLALALKDSKRTKGNFQIADDGISSKHMNRLKLSFQTLWKAFQIAFRVHNFAGGHDENAERLSAAIAQEMETYPSGFWLELVNN